MNNLLRYLKNRKIGSMASRSIYSRTLFAFCLYTGKLPDELAGLKKEEIEKSVEEFCYYKRDGGCCARTVNTALFMIKTFFKVNGFKGNKRLEVESFHQPVRLRTRHEYIPTLNEARGMANVAGSLRDRAIVHFLVSTGLRNSTLRAILYGEVKEELEKGATNILVKVHADMKKVVSSACKGNVEYYVFTSEMATEALRLYMSNRRERFGDVNDQELLFPSGCNRLSRMQRVCRPLTARELQILIKKAARKAGIKDWMHVTPHCLRKTFESVLRSRLTDGSRLDIKTQEYFMGHILPGSMDTYYDKTKVEKLREEYAKLIFTSHDRAKVGALEFLRIVAENLGIDYVQLTESKRRTLGRDLNSEDKLQLLQEAVKRVTYHLKEINDIERRVPSVTDVSERKRFTLDAAAPSIEVPSRRILAKDTRQGFAITLERERKKWSPPLTSYSTPKGNSGRIKSHANSKAQLKVKREVKKGLLLYM